MLATLADLRKYKNWINGMMRGDVLSYKPRVKEDIAILYTELFSGKKIGMGLNSRLESLYLI